MKKNTHGGAGRGQGRKAAHYDGGITRVVPIVMDKSTLAIARSMGAGTIGAGVRRGMSMVCAARRMNDQMLCGRCKLQWDIDDEDPPACGLTVTAGAAPAPSQQR